MIARNKSKVPNIYKLEIEISFKNYHVEYFSALHKIDLYLEDYVKNNLDSVAVIEMSRLQLNEENNYGILIDSGCIKILEDSTEFSIKIFKLKIK